MSNELKKEVKEKIVKFVTQTQKSGPNPISFNEFSFNNPDRHQKMGKQEALAIALKLIKDKKMKLLEDEDTLEEFNQIRILEMVEKDEHKLFSEEYSRFLSRLDIMGSSFNIEESGDYLGGIQFDLIEKISSYVMDMNFEVRQEFVKNFNTYLVRKFYFFDYCFTKISLFLTSCFF